MNTEEIKNSLKFVGDFELIRSLSSDKQFKLFMVDSDADNKFNTTLYCIKNYTEIIKRFNNYNGHDYYFVGYPELVEIELRNRIDALKFEHKLKFDINNSNKIKPDKCNIKELFELFIAINKIYYGTNEYSKIDLELRFNIFKKYEFVLDLFKARYIKLIISIKNEVKL